MPDGRVQIVSYIADKNGYKADVKYTENDPPSRNLQIQSIPDSTGNQIRIPTLKQHTYDYQYDLPTEYDGKSTASLIYSPIGIQANKAYDDYNIIITPTAQPAKNPTFYRVENSQQPNVEIYSNNGINGIAGLGTFILSTAAPILSDNRGKEYRNAVLSTQAPDLENFSPVYINTPKFKVVQNQQDSGLVYGK